MARRDDRSMHLAPGTMTRTVACRRAVAALLVGLAATALVPPARAFDLKDLAASRKRVEESVVRFHETRHIGALTAPVERDGTLLYRRPDYLEMNVETPRLEQLVISGRMLRVRTPAGVRTLSLDSEPDLLAWTESLRATLSGDIPALLRYFDAKLTGDERAWTLVLEPRDAVLRSQIATIVIGGAGDIVRRIETREQDGDDATMEIIAQRPHAP